MEVGGINHLVSSIVMSNLSSISIDSDIYESFVKYAKSENLADTARTVLQKGIQLNLDSKELTKKIAKLCVLTIHPIIQNDTLIYSIDDFVNQETEHISSPQDFGAFIEQLRDVNSEPFQKFLGMVIPTYTQFFRYSELFEFIDKVIIHILVSKNPGNIRALSLGCSLGCEVYSLAMSLSKNPSVPDYNVVGVDINKEAIETAKTGIYSSNKQFDFGSVVDGLTEEQRNILFENKSGSYRIRSTIKNKTEFYVGDTRNMDFLQTLGSYDLIIEQNCLGKYGKTAHQQYIYHIINRLLNRGGFIITDASMDPEERKEDGLYEIWVVSGVDKLTTGMEYKRISVVEKGSKTISHFGWSEERIPLEHKLKDTLVRHGLGPFNYQDYLSMFKGDETFHQVNQVISSTINT